MHSGGEGSSCDGYENGGVRKWKREVECIGVHIGIGRRVKGGSRDICLHCATWPARSGSQDLSNEQVSKYLGEELATLKLAGKLLWLSRLNVHVIPFARHAIASTSQLPTT